MYAIIYFLILILFHIAQLKNEKLRSVSWCKSNEKDKNLKFLTPIINCHIANKSKKDLFFDKINLIEKKKMQTKIHNKLKRIWQTSQATFMDEDSNYYQ